MGPIGIINNPKAKKNLKRPAIRGELESILGDHGTLVETKSIGEIPAAARKFKENGVEILAVNGGDGTSHYVLSAFIKEYGDKPLPKFITLRGGTMNTIPNAVNVKGETLSMARSLVEKVKNGQEIETFLQSTMKINDSYGFIFGFGIPGNFLDAYYYGATNLGPWRAAKVLGRTFGSMIIRSEFQRKLFSKVNAEIICDGEKVPFNEFSGVMSSSINEVGLGFKLTHRAYEKDGHFHFIGSALKPYQYATNLRKLRAGKFGPHPKVFDRPAKEVIIKMEKPYKYTIDGELFSDVTEIVLAAGPKIEMIRGL